MQTKKDSIKDEEQFEEITIERDEESEIDIKWLKWLPKKYLYTILVALAVILIIYLFFGDNNDEKDRTSLNIKDAPDISEKLYQRKSVTLDEIESIVESRKNKKRNRSFESSNRKRYQKGQYVENDRGIVSRITKPKEVNKTDIPINIFSDPRYIVHMNNNNSLSEGNSKIPTGTILYAYLQREISSQEKNLPVIGVIYYPSSYNKPRYVPEGSKIVGKISGVSRDRVSIDFRSGILPDGSKFRISGIALGKDYGTRYEGIVGVIDNKMERRGGGILASSALKATRTFTSLTGSSWGSVFAGEVADQSFDEMQDTIDDGMERYNTAEVILPANTRFLVVVR